MKVILINPAFSDIYGPYRYAARVGASNQIPLGLCYLAATAENDRHEVRLLDCEVEEIANEDELITQIAAFDPDVVGLTATTPLVAKANSIMTRIKQIRPSVLTIFGGVHVTVLAYLRFYLGPRIISYNLKRAGFKATVINMFAFVRSNLASLLENITPRKPRSVTSKGTAY